LDVSSASEEVMRRLAIALAAGIALAACARPQYVYSPTTLTSADVTGLVVTAVALPRERPSGLLRVHSFGIVELDIDGASTAAAHVRLVIENKSRESWRVDGAEQRLEIMPDSGPRLLVALTREGAPAPAVHIAAGETKLIDLFFRLPDDRDTPEELDEYDAIVVVRTGEGISAERVPFERFRAVATPPSDPPSSQPLPSRLQTPQPEHRFPPPKAPQ
jgi:hypothetical protein